MAFEELKNWIDLIIESVNKKMNRSELPHLSRYYEVAVEGDALELTSGGGDPATEYAKGMKVTFIPSQSNTGAVTVDIDGVGPVSFRKTPAEEYAAGEILAGMPHTAVYDGTIFIAASAGGGGGDGSYIHPATHPADIIVESSEKQFASQTEKDSWNSKAEGDHTHTEVLARDVATNTYEVGAAKMKFEENTLWSYMNLDSEGAVLATNKSINLVLDSDNTHSNTHLRVWNGGVGSGHVFSAGEGTDAPVFGPDYHKIYHEGFHPVADKWSAPITMTFDGDASGSVSVDGSGDVTVTLTVAEGGSVNWADIVGKPASTAADIDDAVGKKHGHTSALEDIEDAVGKKHSHANTTVLDGTEESFTTALKNKLDSVETGANAYIHPAEHAVSEVTGLQTALDSKLEDSPADGNEYVRKDGAWAVSTGGGGGISEAPLDGKEYNRKMGTWVEDTGGGTPSDLVTTDTVFQVATLAELETLVASGNLGKPRAANTRDIIQWTAVGETIIDKPYDVIFDNVRFIAVNGGTFSIPLDFTGDYAFKFGAGCEFIAELTSDLLNIRYIRSSDRGQVGGQYNVGSSTITELQALDIGGANQALGAYTFNTETPTINSNTDPYYLNPVDGSIHTDNYVALTTSGRSLTVDLGESKKIKEIKVSRYCFTQTLPYPYTDGEKLEVSRDGVSWYTLFDSDVSGVHYTTNKTNDVVGTPLSVMVNSEVAMKNWVISSSVVPTEVDSGIDSGRVKTANTVFQVGTLAELEALVDSGDLNVPRVANAKAVIQWTATGETIIDKPYDVIFDNIRFVAINGGYFTIPNGFAEDYAFKFGANCEFVAEINIPFSKVRYIRDHLHNNTTNTSNNWVEIEAFDYQGVNVALNKYVYNYYNPTENTNNPINNEGECIAHVTNGLKGTTVANYYYQNINSEGAVVVDLGEALRIQKLNIIHYYGDGRTYFGKKTYISEDGVSWLKIFDEAEDGTYAETSEGKEHYLTGIDPRKQWVISTGVNPAVYSEQSFIVWDEENKCVNFLKSNTTQSVTVGGAVITYDTQEEGVKITFK